MEKPATWENLHYIPIAIFISFPTIAMITFEQLRVVYFLYLFLAWCFKVKLWASSSQNDNKTATKEYIRKKQWHLLFKVTCDTRDYAIAVGLGHTKAGFPYISDTSTNPPESCIFAQFVNIIVVLLCIFVYIRYIQVKECIVAFRGNGALERWNWVGLILGFLSSFGLSLLANFEETSVIAVHLIGAFMCFICGTIYFWLQAVCSYYLHPQCCSMTMVRARIIMATLMTVCLVITLVCGVLAVISHADKRDREWDVNDAGWDLHLASTISEWLFALTFVSYVVSFTGEFKRTQLVGPTLIYKPDELTMSNEVLGVYQEEHQQRVEAVRRIESPPESDRRSRS